MKNMEESEAWKQIAGYEGIYEVSSLGRVRSIDRYNNKPQFVRGRIMRPCIGNHGYYSVVLTRDGAQKRFLVHRLVATTFVDNEEMKPEVNHINGNRKDSRAVNLEWVTRSENHHHAYDALGRGKVTEHLPSYRGIAKPISAAKDGCILRFGSIREAESLGYNAGLVRQCLAGKRASYKGYEWRLA